MAPASVSPIILPLESANALHYSRLDHRDSSQSEVANFLEVPSAVNGSNNVNGRALKARDSQHNENVQQASGGSIGKQAAHNAITIYNRAKDCSLDGVGG